MFEKQPDYSPKFDDLNNQLTNLNSQISQLVERANHKPPETKLSLVTMTTEVITFDTLGYRFCGVYVAAAQTLNVTVQGIAFTLSLTAGINSLPIPAGSTIGSAGAAGSSFQALFIWTNESMGIMS